MTETLSFDCTFSTRGNVSGQSRVWSGVSGGSFTNAIPITGNTTAFNQLDNCGYLLLTTPANTVTYQRLTDILDYTCSGILYIQKVNERKYYQVTRCIIDNSAAQNNVICFQVTKGFVEEFVA